MRKRGRWKKKNWYNSCYNSSCRLAIVATGIAAWLVVHPLFCYCILGVVADDWLRSWVQIQVDSFYSDHNSAEWVH